MGGLIEPGEWRLEYRKRPFTINQVYGQFNYRQRNDLVQEWRQAFFYLAKEQKIPRLDRIKVLAWPLLRDRRVQDVGACIPAVKSAIDGLEDAGVIDEDDPRHVSMIAFGAPLQLQPYDALRIIIQHEPYD